MTFIVYHAAAKGIEIRSMESRLKGDIDLPGFYGIRDDIPSGYKKIRVHVSIDADVPPERLDAIIQLGPTYSGIRYHYPSCSGFSTNRKIAIFPMHSSQHSL